MTFNAYCKEVGINYDRNSFCAYVHEHHGRNLDLEQERWDEIWWDYTIPIDGSTPAAVMDAPHEHPVLEGRDIAGI